MATESLRRLLERYVAEDLQDRLGQPAEKTRLAEDLGIDSLTLMEIALAAEEAIGVPVPVEELREAITAADLESILEGKIARRVRPGAGGAPPLPPPEKTGADGSAPGKLNRCPTALT